MKKVYVMCPAYFSTGGTELLHQLVYKLINVFNVEAYIFYPNVQWKYEFEPTPTKFSRYIEDNWVDNLEDSSDYVLIVPETMTSLKEKYTKAEVWIWWMSVDNFFVSLGIPYKRFENPDFKWKIRKTLNVDPYKKVFSSLKKHNVKTHLFQSEYSRIFLKKYGFENLHPLSDYIDKSLVSSQKKENSYRIDQVLYNPLKGFEITEKLIKSFPEIKWIPIVKMKAKEIAELMGSSKLYLDFGNHPGKDRLPREAVLNGCCIIVNREGAASNDRDIEIPEKFKISSPDLQQNLVINLIKDIFKNYSEQYLYFGNYLNKILDEEKTFEDEVKSLFKLF